MIDPAVPQQTRAISFSAGANLDTNELFGSVAIPFITAKAKVSLNDRAARSAHKPVHENNHKREARAIVIECPPNKLPKANFHQAEIYLDVILLLLLVWFLNREFEISYRLSFHGNAVAVRDKGKVQSMKVSGIFDSQPLCRYWHLFWIEIHLELSFVISIGSS